MRCNVLLQPRPVTLKRYRSLSRRVNQQEAGNPIPIVWPGPIVPSSEPWSAFSMWHSRINFPYSCVCLAAGTLLPERRSSGVLPRVLILHLRLSCLQDVKEVISHHVELLLCEMTLLLIFTPEWFPKTFGTEKLGNRTRGREKVSDSFHGYQIFYDLMASLKKVNLDCGTVHTAQLHHLPPTSAAVITG
jgi:hypothetical protein